MTSLTGLTNIGEVVSTDMLIIGGGIAGLLAAIKARQADPAVHVLVVDKATPGFAGQGRLIGGGSSFVREERLEDWFKWRVEAGGYLNDQDYLYAMGKESYKVQLEMAGWGVPFARDERGELNVRYGGHSADSLWWPSPPDAMQFLRGKARSEGAKLLTRVMIVELLTQGERVAGAVGFSIDSGQFYILKAKATILANGGCMYRWRSWFTTSSGEGVAMAYNVGAEMRNAEFANTTGYCPKDGMWGGRGPGQFLENAKGENICKKYGIPEEDGSNYVISVPAISKEIAAGRGPLYCQVSNYAGEPSSVRARLIKKLGILPDQKIEYILAPSVRQGPVRVDLHGRTTVPGLWAIGDASYGGSAIDGALAPCSVRGAHGVSLAEITGYRAGLDAADFAAKEAASEIDVAEASRLKEQIYAPLERKSGLGPNEAIYQVQEAIIPLKYNVLRSGERMQEALSKVEKVKERLPTLWAKDLHYLVKAHEAASMVLCAEMTYRPALMRQESRGCHMREDYPKQDDQSWLKWIIIKKEKQEMKLWTEPVPLDKYKLKPPKKKA